MGGWKPVTDHRTGRVTEVLACVPAFVFAVYPISVIVGANTGVLPINFAVVGRAVVFMFGLTAILLWALRPLSPSLVARGMWLSCVMLLLGCYGLFAAAASSFSLDPNDWRVAAGFTVASIVFATAIVRPRHTRRRDPIPLNVLATVLLGINVYASLRWSSEVRWRGPVHQLTESTFGSRSGSPHTASRDIYYVVLDGFGRADNLHKNYELDLASFIGFLRSKGFYVAERARSNYSQTFLSLASTLNMSYLDDVAAVMGKNSRDRRPLEHLIRHNALMKIAHQVGYQVVAIGSDYTATRQLDRADVCVCDQHGLDEFEQAAIGATPFGALPLGRWTYDAHRQKVLESFDALERWGAAPNRKFVFAHIVSPHPPFLFAPDGSPRWPHRTGSLFDDGDHFGGSNASYVNGYHDQVLFVTRRLMTFVEDLLRRPGPAPVIVFHGDHGPGSMLRWEDPQATDMAERMDIFAAYYFPDDGSQLYPTMSPVNGARALATRYLGVEVAFLPEKSSFSTWSRPYDFTTVPSETPSDVMVSR
jgi:hypothetical protein